MGEWFDSRRFRVTSMICPRLPRPRIRPGLSAPCSGTHEKLAKPLCSARDDLWSVLKQSSCGGAPEIQWGFNHRDPNGNVLAHGNVISFLRDFPGYTAK